MKCVAPLKGKKRHCWVCSKDHWPKQCAGASRPCHTIDQCAREIIDVSFTIEEWLWFYNTSQYAMLEK